MGREAKVAMGTTSPHSLSQLNLKPHPKPRSKCIPYPMAKAKDKLVDKKAAHVTMWIMWAMEENEEENGLKTLSHKGFKKNVNKPINMRT